MEFLFCFGIWVVSWPMSSAIYCWLSHISRNPKPHWGGCPPQHEVKLNSSMLSLHARLFLSLIFSVCLSLSADSLRSSCSFSLFLSLSFSHSSTHTQLITWEIPSFKKNRIQALQANSFWQRWVKGNLPVCGEIMLEGQKQKLRQGKCRLQSRNEPVANWIIIVSFITLLSKLCLLSFLTLNPRNLFSVFRW